MCTFEYSLIPPGAYMETGRTCRGTRIKSIAENPVMNIQPSLRRFSIIPVLFFLTAPLCFSKSYSIQQVKIHARLLEDGSMDVSESRQYQFDGDYSFAYQRFPLAGPVSCEGFQVMENGDVYSEGNGGAPGTFRISKDGRHLEVRWFFRAIDESRTFTLRYRVRNAVYRYEDAALIHFQFIGMDWDRQTRRVDLTLTPPAPLAKTDLNAWLHGPLWGEYRINDQGAVQAWVSPLPSHTYFDIRALYPRSLFPRAPEKSGIIQKTVMNEEAEWAEQANRERREWKQKAGIRQKRLAAGRWVAVAVSVLALGLWGWLFHRYGRRPAFEPVPRMIPNPPDDTPPALVAYLLNNRRIFGPALTGTLLDLARRGYLVLREERTPGKGLLGKDREKIQYSWERRDKASKPRNDLIPYEKTLIRFLFDEIGEGTDRVEFTTLKKNQSKFSRFFQKWQKEVKKTAETRQWFDRSSIKGMHISLVVSFFLIVLIVPAIYFAEIWSVLLGAVGSLMLFLSVLIAHRTQEGEKLAGYWKAFYRYLKTRAFKQDEVSPLLENINASLIYGVTLGVPGKVIKDLASLIPQDQATHYVPWYVIHGHGTGGFAPQAFGESFSTMIATTASAMSTASGSGGGASGGAGGAGGGGGGAG